jgi:hypothetical protein
MHLIFPSVVNIVPAETLIPLFPIFHSVVEVLSRIDFLQLWRRNLEVILPLISLTEEGEDTFVAHSVGENLR